MTEKEMMDSLQAVWENMTADKSREAYGQMLLLLDNMTYFLRYDLGCAAALQPTEAREGEFNF